MQHAAIATAFLSSHFPLKHWAHLWASLALSLSLAQREYCTALFLKASDVTLAHCGVVVAFAEIRFFGRSECMRNFFTTSRCVQSHST